MKRRRIYSFDVFDTCLARLCGEPRLMFDVLSLKVQKLMGEQCGEHLRQSFVVARAESGGRSLSEIYSNVAQRFPIPCSIEEMVVLELETEKEMLVPIIATRKLVNNLREKGDVIFISDMYLPSSFIRERLIEHGFFKEGDRIYVSDELQAWKSDGSLFRHVHKQEDIAYLYWHHYGDNWHGDYRVPKKLGIHAHLLHYDYLPYEEQWRQMPILQYQYPAILAGVARATRLSSDASDDQKAFVCNISAPLMVSWVLNIMQDAIQHGIKRLYFCARDVHTEYLIASHLQPIYPSVDVRYLFISMKAMETDETLLRSYLIQEGILSNESVALVDSNSSGNTLIRINAIANREYFSPVQGYYLSRWNPSNMLVPTPMDTNSLHYLICPLYSECIASPTVRRLSGMRIIYELLLSINYHKRTVGYEFHTSKIRPIFETDSEDNWRIDGVDIRQAKHNNDKMVLAFSNALQLTRLSSFKKDILFLIAVPTLVEFIDRPNKKYLHYLHHFIYWDKPFVGSIQGKNKGVWMRGNVFYCLPSFLSFPLIATLSNINLRLRLNRMLAWTKRK